MYDEIRTIYGHIIDTEPVFLASMCLVDGKLHVLALAESPD